MRKRPALWLICALSLLLCGCGRRAEPPTPTPKPVPAETAVPAAAEPTPAPTAEPTPEPTPAAPALPEWVRTETDRTYLLLAGPGGGAVALKNWLMGEGASRLADCVPQGLDEPLFTLTFTPRDNAAEIASATEETRYVRLAVDGTILDSAILADLLPVFERDYGYTVEVFSGAADTVPTWADSARADVVLLAEGDAAALSRRGFASVTAYAAAGYALETP